MFSWVRRQVVRLLHVFVKKDYNIALTKALNIKSKSYVYYLFRIFGFYFRDRFLFFFFHFSTIRRVVVLC